MNNEAFKIFKKEKNESNHKIRKEGFVPCIIYGEALNENISGKIPKSNLLRLFKENTNGSIIPLNLDNSIKNCFVKEIQKDNFGNVIHVDFQYVIPNEVVNMKIPVTFIGEENLELKKLVFEVCSPVLEFHGNVEKIPESIEIDISDMNFDDKIFAKDIEVPSDVELLTNPDTILAVVSA